MYKMYMNNGFVLQVTDAINEEMVEQVKEKYSVNASLSLTEAWDTMQKDVSTTQ